MSKNKIQRYRAFCRTYLIGSTDDKGIEGFSLIELMTSLVITLIVLAVAVATFSNALHTRTRESSKTDALNSAQAAINVMSREISNSGYGLTTNTSYRNNGIVLGPPTNPDSDDDRLHFRANTTNNDLTTDDAGEDVTFFYDEQSESVVRYDANTGLTSGIINRISEVDFAYWDYAGSSISGPHTLPSENTGRITITLTVKLPDVQGQPPNQVVQFSSDVTLRNSNYMLSQY